MKENVIYLHLTIQKDVACRLQINASVGPHAETFTSDAIRSGV